MLHQAPELVCRSIVQSLTGKNIKEHEIKILKKHIRRPAPQLLSIFNEEQNDDKKLLEILKKSYKIHRYKTPLLLLVSPLFNSKVQAGTHNNGSRIKLYSREQITIVTRFFSLLRCKPEKTTSLCDLQSRHISNTNLFRVDEYILSLLFEKVKLFQETALQVVKRTIEPVPVAKT